MAWVQGIEDENLFITAVTLGEIQKGIELARKQDRQSTTNRGVARPCFVGFHGTADGCDQLRPHRRHSKGHRFQAVQRSTSQPVQAKELSPSLRQIPNRRFGKSPIRLKGQHSKRR